MAAFVDVYLAIWDVESLTLAEKAVLAAIARRADGEGLNAFPSEQRIAFECSLSLRSVRDTLHRLANKGWIKRQVKDSWSPRHPVFGRYVYSVAILRIMDEAELGEDRLREVLEEARSTVRQRVAAFRSKGGRKPDVTANDVRCNGKSCTNVTANGVDVTANPATCNGTSCRRSIPITTPAEKIPENCPVAGFQPRVGTRTPVREDATRRPPGLPSPAAGAEDDSSLAEESA